MKFKIYRYKILPALIVSLTFLSACGSDSSDSNTSEIDKPVTPPVTPVDPNLPTPTLTEITVTALNSSTALNLSWNDPNAERYRVLYWNPQGELRQWETVQQNNIIATTDLSAGGQVIVEAYDTLGNSIFSAPITVEVQQ